MIISAWECKCGMYNTKLATNLKPLQHGQNHKDSIEPFLIMKVVRNCRNIDCTQTKSVKVIGK